MSRASERRMQLFKILCNRRYDTIFNLASEFGVSVRTIRRDIEILSSTEPIYTQTGRYGGGVYIVEGFSSFRMYMNDEEISLLHKLLNKSKEMGVLTDVENKQIERIICQYTKPKPKRKDK